MLFKYTQGSSQWEKHFTRVSSFNPPCSSLKVVLLPPFYTWGNWGSMKLSKSPKDTQLVSDKARIWTQGLTSKSLFLIMKASSIPQLAVPCPEGPGCSLSPWQPALICTTVILRCSTNQNCFLSFPQGVGGPCSTGGASGYPAQLRGWNARSQPHKACGSDRETTFLMSMELPEGRCMAGYCFTVGKERQSQSYSQKLVFRQGRKSILNSPLCCRMMF